MIKDSAVFVIGAAGYIGRKLFDSPFRGRGVYGTSSSGSSDFFPFRLEVPDEFDYERIRVEDIVFLTAAISAPDLCAREHDRAWAVNVAGTSSFIQRVIDRGARVIFFSSDSVYGERENAFDERISCHPTGEYAVMKYEVEQRFSGNPRFKAIRLSYVFSREDKFTRYLIGCVQNNVEAEIFHPFCRSVVHRDDVVAGALRLAERWKDIPQQVINFGGQQVLSRVEFAECLREAYLHDLRFKVTEPSLDFFKNRPRVVAMTSPVFASLLGRPPRSLRQAIRLEFASSSNVERLL